MKNKNTYNKKDLLFAYKKLKNSRGLTLIELMITVAIVGILAALALPAYQDYVARSQVSEGLVLASGAKPVIAEYYSNHGSYPTATDIGFNGYTGSYVDSTTIGTNGTIIATFSNDAHRQLRGQTVTLTPEEDTNTGNLKWSCGSSVDSKYLPTSCSNDGSSDNSGGNPGNGETDPGEGEVPGTVTPPTDFDFINGTATYSGGHTYQNNQLIFNGSILTGTMVDEKMVFDNNGQVLTIDKNGDLTVPTLSGSNYRAELVFSNGQTGYMDIFYPDISLNTKPIVVPKPNYTFSNPQDQQIYQNYINESEFGRFAVVDMGDSLSTINMGPYQENKDAFVNMLNQKIANGESLPSEFTKFLYNLEDTYTFSY